MTRLEMEAIINAGGTVLWNGKILYTIEELPTQEEIDELLAPPSIGPQGYSAYEVAVDEGFVGTEEEWLESLIGPQGPQGEQGIQGEPGEGSGDVIGPASSTNDNIAVFDGVTGKLLKDGGATLASKQDALGFTPVPNTRTVNSHALSADVTVTKSDVGLGNADNTSDANKPVSTAQQTALDLKANDDAVVHDTGDETIAGVKTFSSDPIIPDEAYDATAWNGSLEPATKNAIRDKIEALGAGGLTADLQTFTSSGTWTKPANAKMVYIMCLGAGGGGASGGRNQFVGNNRYGGSGGAGGGVMTRLIRAALVGSTETVTVGAGGAGGASLNSNGSVGNPGTDGGTSSFGAFCGASGGTGGTGSNPPIATPGGSNSVGPVTTAGSDGSALWIHQFGTIIIGGIGGAGASSSTGGGGKAVVASNYPALHGMGTGGGGGGGGIDSSNNQRLPGTGATYTTNGTDGGGAAGQAGADNSGTDFKGGGGGASNSAGAGWAGGNAGIGAGGGGGGGATGAVSSGAGGNGGNGLVIVISW